MAQESNERRQKHYKKKTQYQQGKHGGKGSRKEQRTQKPTQELEQDHGSQNQQGKAHCSTATIPSTGENTHTRDGKEILTSSRDTAQTRKDSTTPKGSNNKPAKIPKEITQAEDTSNGHNASTSRRGVSTNKGKTIRPTPNAQAPTEEQRQQNKACTNNDYHTYK